MQGRVNKSGLVHFLLGLVSSRATGQLIGLIAVLSIIWFAGRIVGLDTTDKKLIAMAAVTAVFIVFIFIRWLWTKRSGDKLASELASHNAGSSAELDEIKVIEQFLPEAISEDEIESEVKKVIDQTGAEGMKDMGKVMGIVTKKLMGKADGKTISTIVRNNLN